MLWLSFLINMSFLWHIDIHCDNNLSDSLSQILYSVYYSSWFVKFTLLNFARINCLYIVVTYTYVLNFLKDTLKYKCLILPFPVCPAPSLQMWTIVTWLSVAHVADTVGDYHPGNTTVFSGVAIDTVNYHRYCH